MRKDRSCVILVVDENPKDLRRLGYMLKEFGDILFATSGQTAFRMAAQRQPDLVICNLNMSDLNGIELCKHLKKKKATRDISVVLLSHELHEEQEIAALEAGATDFITNPVNDQVVKARIKTHLNTLQHKNLLRLLADKDGLTEVFNRRYFENQSRVELKRHYRQQQPLSLALIDIDHFKAFNDAYGHLQGDVCLREVAHTIERSTRRPGEFVARYGGEEFAVVLPSTNIHNAKKYGEWICERVLSLAIPHGHSDTVPFITISVGLATVVPSSRTTMENLIATADSALYLAKESGRNQYKVATIEQEVIREAG